MVMTNIELFRYLNGRDFSMEELRIELAKITVEPNLLFPDPSVDMMLEWLNYNNWIVPEDGRLVIVIPD